MNQIEEVSKYIEENKLPLISVEDGLFKDDNGKLYLIIEEKDGLLFDQDFSLILTDEELLIKADFYLFNFGGLFYYIESKTAKEPKLKILRYIGINICELQKETEFVHLGVHGMNELLNGCQKYEFWCDKANYLGIRALGICERNTLASALKFQEVCKKKGIKSIIGEEICVKGDKTYYFKLYAKNDNGWKNLINISNIIRCFGNEEETPSIKEEDLIEYLNDIIVIFPNSYTFSDEKLSKYSGVDIYYQIDTVEFLNADAYYSYLTNIKNYLETWSGDVPPVLIGDAYYLDEEDKYLQNILNKIDGRTEFKFTTKTQHFKSIQEHWDIFIKFWKDKEDIFDYIFKIAINNTKVIADKCEFFVHRDNLHLPAAKIDGVDEIYNLTFLNQLIDHGMEKHGFRGNPKYEERLQEEYRTIVGADLENYFLILWDIVNHCKKVNNYTGYGRGSACGCLITYLIGITKIDPFDYDLLFSRFLNAGRVARVVYDIYLDGELTDEYTGIFKLDYPLNCEKFPFNLKVGEEISGKKITKIEKRYEGHVSMPDIDLDIEDREEVKQYLISKYGRERFTVIGSYNTFKIKAGVKDLARVVGTNLDYAALNALTNRLFFKEGSDAYFEEIFRTAQTNSFFKEFIFENPKLINSLYWIIDTPKTSSIHPCACMLIPDDEKDIFDYFPMFKQKEEFVCEWEGGELDELGFLKEDLLGLSQLEFLHNICNLIKKNKNIDLDVFSVPLDDEGVFEYFQKGWNSEVFQFNSYLLVNYCKLLKPVEIMNLITAVAAVRPGPMNNGLHLKYVKRKNGEEEVDYKFGYRDFTQETYGLILFQEQLIRIASYLGDLDLVEGDGLRKALGKKLLDKMQSYKELIKPKAIEKGCPSQEFEDIWSEMVEFAKYAFNKSHAAAYAITGYISQWLKVHYSIEFWTAAFEKANDSDKRKEKFNQYFKELLESNSPISVVSPEINTASNRATNDNDSKIYFPLNNIKYLSNNGVENILADRKKNGKFYSFEEFLIRLGKEKLLDKREFENLILSGVFDEIEELKSPIERKGLIINLYNYLKRDYREFFLDPFQENELWWSLKQWELLGVTSIDYQKLCNKNYGRYSYFKSIRDLGEEQKVTFGGIILDFIVKRTKKKQDFGEVTLENDNVPYTLIMWPEVWEEYKDQIEKYKGYVVLFEASAGRNNISGNLQFTFVEDTVPVFLGSTGELLEKPKPLSFAKWDKVKLATDEVGTIIKYPSNQAISVEIADGKGGTYIKVVDKFSIKELVEKYIK